MDLIEAVKKLLAAIRDAAADGRISLREAVEIAVALGEVLRIIGQIIPGEVKRASAGEHP